MFGINSFDPITCIALLRRTIPPGCILAGLAVLSISAAARDRADYSIDNAKCKVEITVYKAGFLKAFGHDHLIGAGQVSGRVEFDAEKLENSSVSFKIAAKSLSVLDPGESEKNRSEIQATMTGSQVLEVSKFPEIAFSSSNVSVVKMTPDGWTLIVAGTLQLHGVQKPLSIPLQLRVDAGQIVAQGEVFLQQTDYGIAPVSVAGGSIKVKDRLRIDFKMVATRP